VYAQDNWRASRRLTLNYGLRWEFYGVQHNNDQSLDSNFYYGTGSNLFQTVRNGSVMTAPNSPVGEMWNPNYGTLSPRIGFAYDVFGDGTTSLRGGFGISYERNFGNITFNVIQNPAELCDRCSALNVDAHSGRLGQQLRAARWFQRNHPFSATQPAPGRSEYRYGTNPVLQLGFGTPCSSQHDRCAGIQRGAWCSPV